MLIVFLILAACNGAAPQPAPPAAPPAEDPAAPGTEPVPGTEPAPGTAVDDEIPIDPELGRASAIRATTLVGLDVEDANAQYIGNVDDAFVIVSNGDIQYVVISAGGLEGAFTDWMLPLPLEALAVSSQRNSVIVSSQAANLVNAPGFERETWPDLSIDDWDTDIRTYWADIVDIDDTDAPTPTPAVDEEIDEEEIDETDVEATPTPEEEVTEETDATPTPVAEEEADATPTPEAEEEAVDEEMDEVEETDATPTPAAEEEAVDEEMDEVEETDATPTPATEEEAVTDEEMDDELLVRVPYAMSVNMLLDFEIYDATGENLGEVEDFVIDWEEGKIQYVVLSFGGFLGIGDSWFAFPWNELVFDPLENAFITTVTEEALADAPGFDRDNWPDLDDPTWDTQYQEYWETR